MSLKEFLKQAYRETYLSWSSILATVEQLDVTLQAGRDNKILVYGGTFNPPHPGHVDVLLSALGPHIDVAAIVILPCEDYLLDHKFGDRPNDIRLSLQRRAEILTALPRVPKHRVWVWNSTYHPFQAMTKALQQIVSANALEVTFSHMVGPDNLRLRDPLAILPYFAPSILVTNKARHIAGHFMRDGFPVEWSGFGQWSCEYDSHSNSNSTSEQEVLCWTCESLDESQHTKGRGYYLQFTGPRPQEINSTSIRYALQRDCNMNNSNLETLQIADLLSILKLEA